MSTNAPHALPVNVPRTGPPTLDHERLEVYHLALQFHALALTLVPRRGLRALRDQLERASLGVVLCIAEGAGRTAGADKRRFYEMAAARPRRARPSSTSCASAECWTSRRTGTRACSS